MLQLNNYLIILIIFLSGNIFNAEAVIKTKQSESDCKSYCSRIQKLPELLGQKERRGVVKSLRKDLEQCNSLAQSKEVAIQEQGRLIAEVQANATKLEQQLSQKQRKCNRRGARRARASASNCLPFENSPGLHMIQLPGYRPFQVYCERGLSDSELGSGTGSGSGWTVIQRRLTGDVNFYRSWEEYRVGFGDLSREFFMGLEKLHQLTSHEPYELLIITQDFRGDTRVAYYDDFRIGNESTNYKLLSVGEFKGNTSDALILDEGRAFTTYDRDNDRKLDLNCAQFRHGAWWFKSCSWSNLNGDYFSKDDQQLIFWRLSSTSLEYVKLKTVQMLIRSTAEEEWFN